MPRLKASNLSREINERLEDAGITKNNVNVFLSENTIKEKEPFTKLFQKQSGVIFSAKPVTAKILMYFLCASSYGNYIEADVSDISLLTRISESSVKRAIKELIEMKVLLRDKDLNDKRRNTYYINPHMAWKGNPGDRIKSIEKLDKKDQLSLPFLENK